MNDDKAQAIINRGNRADIILNDEVFKEACASLEAELIEAWKGWKDAEGRERLWQGVNMLGKIQDRLRLYMRDGRLERQRIEELATGEPQRHLSRVA